jgi:hypothetical protein
MERDSNKIQMLEEQIQLLREGWLETIQYKIKLMKKLRATQIELTNIRKNNELDKKTI